MEETQIGRGSRRTQPMQSDHSTGRHALFLPIQQATDMEEKIPCPTLAG